MTGKPSYEELEQRVKVLEMAETERKQAEEALQESKNRFKLLFEQSPLGIEIYDSDGLQIQVNPANEKLWNIKAEESVLKYNVKQDRLLEEKGLKHFVDKAYNGEAIITPDFEYDSRKVGYEKSRLRLLRTHLYPIIDSAGIVTNIVLLHEDITDRKQAEEALKKSEEKLRAVFETIGDGIDILNINGDILDSNEAFLQMFGYSCKEDVIGKNASEFFAPKELKRAIDTINNVQDGVKSKTQEFRLKKFSGEEFDAETTHAIIFDDSEKPIGFVAVTRDITKRKQAEKQLQQTQKMEAVGTLAGGIAHDFNNMLGVIIGNTELAMDEVPEWSPARHNLEQIETASLRSKDVVKQLLSFCRRTDPEQKPVNISPIIKDSLKFLRSSIPTSIEIQRTIPDTSGTILATPTQIHQVMMNLCINAAHVMSENGGTMEVSVSDIEIAKDEIQDPALTQGQYVKISVRDTGDGISKENLNRIFDPYFTTKEVGKGSGLGLSVVHGIVQNHNGVVSVDSEVGIGTTFDVFFPVVEEEPATKEDTDTTIPTGNEKILFVDDEEAILSMTSEMLERLGYTVTPKSSGMDILETFQAQPESFDLIISDMTMPNITGDKLAERLQQIRPDIPIILCTGFSDRINDEKAKSIGIRALVMKPIVKSVLAKTIRKVLD